MGEYYLIRHFTTLSFTTAFMALVLACVAFVSLRQPLQLALKVALFLAIALFGSLLSVRESMQTTGAAPTPNKIEMWAQQTRSTIVKQWEQTPLTDAHRSYLTAITLGEKKALSRQVRQAYIDTGIAHVLALSGMHIGFIALLAGWLIPRKTPEAIKRVLLLIGIWSFVLLTGMLTSAVRAAIMMSLYLLHPHRNERTSTKDTWALAAICMLLAHPHYLTDIGFQLSFAAVAGIVWFGAGAHPQGIAQRLWQGIRICLAAQIAVLPLSVWYFGQIPLYFLLTNLLVCTLLVPISIYLTVAVTISCFLLTPLVSPLTWLLNGLLNVQEQLVLWLSQLPGGQLYVLKFTLTDLLSTYLLVAASFYYLKQRSRHRFIVLQIAIIVFLASILLS